MITLGVIFGGKTCEHDVSIISAIQFMHAVDKGKYIVQPIYISRDGDFFTGEKLCDMAYMKNFSQHDKGITQVSLEPEDKRLALYSKKAYGIMRRKPRLCIIDVVVPVMHGMNGEDGTLQGMLELWNIPFTSSGTLGSALGMDKIAMKQFFIGCGFPVLDYVWFERMEYLSDSDEIINRIEKQLGFPVFVKPANLGSSIGISRATDKQSLIDAIDVAISFDRRILVEKGMDNPREINCSALGYSLDIQASVCEMPVSWQEFLTFDDKYLRGGKKLGGGVKTPSSGMESLARKIPAPVSPELTLRIQNMTRDVFKYMDCKGVVRIDYLLSQDDELYINEINSIPGSMAYYLWEASGIPFPELIERLVECALIAHSDKNRSTFAYDSTILRGAMSGDAAAKFNGK